MPLTWWLATDNFGLIEELNEEDQQLKSELEMLVERLKVHTIYEFTRRPEN